MTVNRLTLVDHTGRVYERTGVSVTLDYQDDGQTLKVLVTDLEVRDQAVQAHGAALAADIVRDSLYVRTPAQKEAVRRFIETGEAQKEAVMRFVERGEAVMQTGDAVKFEEPGGGEHRGTIQEVVGDFCSIQTPDGSLWTVHKERVEPV